MLWLRSSWRRTLMRVDLENRCQSLQEELAFRKDVPEEVDAPTPSGSQVFPTSCLPASGTHHLISASIITSLSSVSVSYSDTGPWAWGHRRVQDGLEPCILITLAKTLSSKATLADSGDQHMGMLFRGRHSGSCRPCLASLPPWSLSSLVWQD